MADQPSSDGQPPERRRRRRRRRSRGRKPAASASTEGQPRTPTEGSARSSTKSQQKRQPSGKRRRPSATPVQREISAGGVVYRRDGEAIEVVLASRRTRRGDLAWGLAKGGVEPGESLEDAAVREVLEETGYIAEIESSLGDTRYFYVWKDTRIRKTVHFFLMRCTGGDPDDRDDEMEEVRWFPLDRALKRAAYRGEREVLGRAAEILR